MRSWMGLDKEHDPRMTEKKRAKRLSTEERRDQILESAAHLILNYGVSRCTLESVAVEAGISKALIYRHFNSREELFKAVLKREYAIMRERRVGAFTETLSLEDFLRSSQPRTFQYLHDRGPIVRAMFSDRSVANLLRDDDTRHRASVLRFYVRKVADTYALPERTALLGVLLIMNASVSSARALRSFSIDPKEAADFWATFVLGGWTAISAQDQMRQING